ncbi:hypothetical protein AE621_26185 [Acidovorax sp. SD340]|nr:hypothetical protein AE621_26185 [Acidovorax sp. SD340]
MMVIAASLLHGGRVARVGRGLGQRFRLGLVRVVGDGGCFLSKSTCTALTPATFSSDFLTVIGHSGQVMFWTASVTVFDEAASAANGKATSRAMSNLRMANSFQ